jgi:TonB family protein
MFAPLILSARDRVIVEPLSGAVIVTTVTTVSDVVSSRWLDLLDPVLLTVWLIASAALVTQVFLALRTLRRVARNAQRVRLDEEDVLVDSTLGPAVIGIANPVIVIPAWLLDLDEALRSIVLRHEREHCRAQDPRLVWLAVVTTTLLPWNAPLWWMARRLRDAMEIDCDARTLRDGDDRTLYARVLLLIAQQKTSARFAPMLSNSTAQLHRRIVIMHAPPPRHPMIRATIAASVAILAIATACSGRVASNLISPEPKPASSPTATEPASLPPTVVSASEADLADGPARLLPNSRGPVFPEALKAEGVSGAVLTQFVVNSDGTVDTSSVKILRSTDPAFSAAVRAELTSIRFAPARVGGRAVRQLVTQAFQFEAARVRASIVTPPAAGSPKPAGTPATGKEPYFDFQVESPAKVRSGQGPQYPKELRDAGIEGQVLVQFVVDSTGSVDMRTFKVLKSNHQLFTDATRTALAAMQFAPATVGGRKVSQLLQTPFMFSLSR